MQFDTLDQRMREFETAHDLLLLPDVWVVARLDGRNFTRLTRAVRPFKAPFDQQFRDLMLVTAEHVMTCGFSVQYAWTASDELSLVFVRNQDSFGRKERKLLSILAGEASAAFSATLQTPACFDCRLSQLPTAQHVVDYFRWRSEDAHRNALNAHCYWLLRGQGWDAQQANNTLVGQSISGKNELLFQNGINFNDLPSWQKRGVGLFWEIYSKPAFNPQTGESVMATRRRIKREGEVPLKDAYDSFVLERLHSE